MSDSDREHTARQAGDGELQEAEVAVLASAVGLTLEPDEVAGITKLLSRYRQHASALVGLQLDEESAVSADPFSQWTST